MGWSWCLVVIQPCTTLKALKKQFQCIQIFVFPDFRVPNSGMVVPTLCQHWDFASINNIKTTNYSVSKSGLVVQTLGQHCSRRVWDATQGRGWGYPISTTTYNVSWIPMTKDLLQMKPKMPAILYLFFNKTLKINKSFRNEFITKNHVEMRHYI